MHATIPGFRALFHALEEYSGDSAYDAVLQPTEKNPSSAPDIARRSPEPIWRQVSRSEAAG